MLVTSSVVVVRVRETATRWTRMYGVVVVLVVTVDVCPRIHSVVHDMVTLVDEVRCHSVTTCVRGGLDGRSTVLVLGYTVTVVGLQMATGAIRSALEETVAVTCGTTISRCFVRVDVEVECKVETTVDTGRAGEDVAVDADVETRGTVDVEVEREVETTVDTGRAGDTVAVRVDVETRGTVDVDLTIVDVDVDNTVDDGAEACTTTVPASPVVRAESDGETLPWTLMGGRIEVEVVVVVVLAWANR